MGVATTPHQQLMVVYLHNGFSASVTGNEKAIDAIKDLVVPNTLVKGIVIYNLDDAGVVADKFLQLNYKAIKAVRNV